MLREWARLALFLALLVAGIAVLRWDAWRNDRAAARAHLEAQVRAIADNLGQQLSGADAALRALRGRVDAGELRAADPAALRELQTLSAAMPGIRTLSVLDADGRVRLSNRPELVDGVFAGREYFLAARERNDPALLQLSTPFRTSLGVYSMNLSLSRRGPDGRFVGVVTATLDPDYFRTAMQAALYAPDMWAGLGHEGGTLVLQVPPRPELEGARLDRPGSMFERHRSSGQVSSFFAGTLAATGERRMIAHHTLEPAGLSLDHGLVLALTRDADAVDRAWRDTTAS